MEPDPTTGVGTGVTPSAADDARVSESLIESYMMSLVTDLTIDFLKENEDEG